MRFRDIESFPRSSYRVNIGWDYLEDHLKSHIETGLDLDPDFQRAHVWSQYQQEKYVEYILRGGTSGRELYFNCFGFSRGKRIAPYVIVDGKQRLQAVRLFLADKIKAFGCRYSEYTDRLDILIASFSWNVAELPTRADVLKWYLGFNEGGSVHTEAELARVKKLLAKEPVA